MLDKNGFTKKTYSQIVDEMEAKAKELFGEDVNTKAYTPLGIILRIFAWFHSILWDNTERVYNNSFPSTSEGISLDRAVTFKGLSRIQEDYARGTIKITGTVGATVEAPFIVGTVRNVYFETVEDVILDETGIAIVDMYAQESGVQANVGVGEVTEILNPDSNVVSVTNEEATVGGRNRETDSELHARYKESYSNIKSSNTNSIQMALLGVVGVRDASVSQNETMIEIDGIPPKSIAPFVFGGTDADVAAAIFNMKAAGIQSHGSTIVTVYDSKKNSHDIGFTRPDVLQIHVRVTLVKKDTFPTNGKTTIQTQIINYIGGTDVAGVEHSGLGLDEDVIHAKLVAKALSVDSVEDAKVELSSDGVTYTQTNITITANRVAKAALDRVVVS